MRIDLIVFLADLVDDCCSDLGGVIPANPLDSLKVSLAVLYVYLFKLARDLSWPNFSLDIVDLLFSEFLQVYFGLTMEELEAEVEFVLPFQNQDFELEYPRKASGETDYHSLLDMAIYHKGSRDFANGYYQL